MKEKVKQLKFNFVVAALLYVLLGVVLLVWPDTSSSIICYIIGTVLLIYGIVNLIAFLMSKDKTILLVIQLVIGVAAAALGVLSLTKPQVILSILPVLMGIFIIVVSIMSLKRALDMRRYFYERWWVPLLLALAAIGLGLLILFHPYMTAKVVTALTGAVLLYVGICELWSIATTSRLAKEYLKSHPVDPIDPL